MLRPWAWKSLMRTMTMMRGWRPWPDLKGSPSGAEDASRCFGLRLYRTALYARERGIKVIATTLASSRWKSLEQIDRAGRWACAKANSQMPDLGACSVADRDAGQDISTDVIWWDRNWRKGGLQSAGSKS